MKWDKLLRQFKEKWKWEKYWKCSIGYEAFKKPHLKGTPSKDFLEDKNFLRAFLVTQNSSQLTCKTNSSHHSKRDVAKGLPL